MPNKTLVKPLANPLVKPLVKPLLLAWGLMALAAPVANAAPQAIDRIVAIANDGVILESELLRNIKIILSQLKSRGVTDAPPDEVLRPQVLERMVVMRLQNQKAQEQGIRIDDRELNEVLTGIAAQNGLSLAEFAEGMRREGIDYLAIREQIKDEVLASRLRQKEIEGRVVVTDQEIDYLLSRDSLNDSRQYRLSHILIPVPDGANSEERATAQKKAEDLRQKLLTGADFAQTAIANSAGEQALKGGDLDWKSANDLPTLFAEAAPKLKVGGLSEVLPAANGYHLLKLIDTKGGEEAATVTELRARHILVQTNKLRTDDQARVIAESLYKKLKDGADFVAMAKEQSDDPGSKNNGGDLGFVAPGVFVPEFQIRLDQLKINEISAPFHTQYGWHIAQVLEKRERDLTDDNRRNRARATIANRKAAEEYDVWLRRLRDDAYVEFRLNP